MDQTEDPRHIGKALSTALNTAAATENCLEKSVSRRESRICTWIHHE